MGRKLIENIFNVFILERKVAKNVQAIESSWIDSYLCLITHFSLI